MVWAAQILCGNAILGFSVLFLQNAGFSEVQSFNVNISLSACYIVGGIISWFRECISLRTLVLYSLPCQS